MEEQNERQPIAALYGKDSYLLMGIAQCLQWAQYCRSQANLLTASRVVCKIACLLKLFPSVLI